MLSRQDKEMATIVFVKKKKVSFCFILKHDCVHVRINQKSNRSSISLRSSTDYSYQVGGRAPTTVFLPGILTCHTSEARHFYPVN